MQSQSNCSTGPESTVLVVDDAPQARRLVCEVLKRHGYKPIDAADGDVAIHCLEELHCDAVVTDLEMPNVSGEQLISMIRSSRNPQIRRLPIIVISSKTDDETIIGLKSLGIDAFIEKPVDKGTLIETIDRLLHDRG